MVKKMKSFYRIFLLSALLLSPFVLHASDEGKEFGARVSAAADYKVAKGLHVFVSEELRFGGKDIMDRSYTEVGASYKLGRHLKVGLSYTAIAIYESEATMLEDNIQMTRYWYDWRHRITGDIQASFKAGQWKFSLRERIQGTHKVKEINNYQNPQTSWVLRTRLKAAYEFRKVPLEPYVYFEPRLYLNGANWSGESMTADFLDAQFLGHNDMYFNRLRGSVGVEWRLSKRSALDFYCLYDHLRDKEIDARKEGSDKGISLKIPVYWQTVQKLSLGVGYKFSF